MLHIRGPAGYRHQYSRLFGRLCKESMSGRAFIERLLIGLFFPASGNRNNSTGALASVSTNGNYWSALPNSATNGYNLNFNSGNVNPLNSNNRSNGFSVRPVAELCKMNVRQPSDRDLVKEVFRAYFDARRHKRGTTNQLEFEIDFEHHLFTLASQIQDRTYTVGRSICFIVNNPVKREVFAADFRDRVVHHLIFNRVNPLVERKLIRDCYSCRKGKGTLDGIERLEHHIRSVTDNHTREAWVLKLDIQGYFMSIDRRRLWEIVERLVADAQNKGGHKRLDEALYLLQLVIFNDPTDGCVMKGDPKEWDGLPPSKSLFHSPPGCGLPIGNLTSQMFSNIYLSEFDNWVKRELKMRHYGRYVDDFYFLHSDKYTLIEVRDRVTEYLKDNFGLTVHPKKIYLQNVNHGVTFLGAHVKPHRRYARNRTLGQIRHNLRAIDAELLKRGKEVPENSELYAWRGTYNSCLGYLGQFKSLGLRRELWKESEGFRRYFYINAAHTKISIKSKYRPELADPLPEEFSGLFPEFYPYI